MPDSNRKLRVFLCHAKEDKPTVRELFKQLSAEGWMDVWLDEVKLLPGQEWDIEIEKAVEQADVVIVCLSNQSVDKEGYVQKELRFVLNIADEKPESTIFVIPLRLDDCTVPRRIRNWQYLDYFPKSHRKIGYPRVLESLKLRATKLGISIGKAPLEPKPVISKSETKEKPSANIEISRGVKSSTSVLGDVNIIIQDSLSKGKRNALPYESASLKEQPKKVKTPAPQKPKAKPKRYTIKSAISKSVSILPELQRSTLGGNSIYTFGDIEFVLVPKGKFIMGSKDDNVLAWAAERPQHEVNIPYDYWIGRFPITNVQYAEFAENKSKISLKGGENYPVVNVPWRDAKNYTTFLNRRFTRKLPQGYKFRLPTEAEWEKAARGIDGREWPWGNEFDRNKCNLGKGDTGNITPVGVYSPQGDSPYGAADMGGNVWEWTNSLVKPYPYDPNDGRESPNSSGLRILRGSAFYYSSLQGGRGAFRFAVFPNFVISYYGFRIVVAPPLS